MDEDPFGGGGGGSPFTSFGGGGFGGGNPFGGASFGGGGMPGAFPTGEGIPRAGGRRASSMGGMRSESAARPPDVIHPLKLSLDDIFKGTKKHLKLKRKLLDGSTESKDIEIDVLPVSPFSSCQRHSQYLFDVAGMESRD